MGTHGSESYFVVGEGLLGETAGGGAPTVALPSNIAAVTPTFRFSRLGPKGTRQAAERDQSEGPFNDPERNLAFRNLPRANMVTLATGQQMATFSRERP